MTDVLVLRLPGGMASSLAITLDALDTANRIATRGGRQAPFTVQSLTAADAARTRFIPGQVLVIPGLGTANEADLLARLASPAVKNAIRAARAAHAAGACVTASCASTFILADAGLLAGRRATTTWWLAPLFRRRHPEVELAPDEIVTLDWPVATAGAAMAQMDLMLKLIAGFASPGLAQASARYLLLDERKSQAPYMAVGFMTGLDDRISQAETWVKANISRDFSMVELAGAVGMTPRTFARRLGAVCGLSPVRFTQRIRLEAAEHLLETTRLPVDEVARRVGYAEPSTLRRLIRREARRSPAELRRGQPAISR